MSSATVDLSRPAEQTHTRAVMNPLRSLFLLSDFRGGGAQKTLLNLAGAIDDDGFQVEFAVADSRGPAARWVPEGLVLHDLKGRSGMARSIPALTRLIRTIQPDIILSTMIHANIATWIAAHLARCDAAIVLRETNSLRARHDIATLHRCLAAIAYRHSDLVVALSEGVRLELVEDMRLVPERTLTIPNPVDVDHIRARVNRARKLPSPLPPYRNGPTILGIGRLVRQKGFDILIEAVARHLPRARVVLLGEGPDRAALEKQAQRLGCGALLVPGFVSDVTPYLAHADLFVLSSRWEGFGHVIVEAMAAGLPIVATDCPYGPGEILEHEVTGLLVPPEDADALGDAIGLMTSTPLLSRHLASAADTAAESFRSSHVAARYVQALKAAATKRANDSRGFA